MSRQWMLPNGVGIDETGTRDWNAMGVGVSEALAQVVTPLQRIVILGGGVVGRWIGINVIGWRTEE